MHSSELHAYDFELRAHRYVLLDLFLESDALFDEDFCWALMYFNELLQYAYISYMLSTLSQFLNFRLGFRLLLFKFARLSLELSSCSIDLAFVLTSLLYEMGFYFMIVPLGVNFAYAAPIYLFIYILNSVIFK